MTFNEKWILCDKTVNSSMVGLRRQSKALPKAKFAPKQKKGQGHCLWCFAARLICYRFLNPSKSITSERHTQQSNEMHWKICNACSQCWSTERVQFFYMTTPDHASHNQHFKSWTNWAVKFCLIWHICWASDQLTTTSSMSWRFAGKMLPRLAGCRKCYPRVFWISKHGILHYRKNQTFLVGKSGLIVMVPILINKGVFEPSYSDLKFTVRSWNYIFTNLLSPSSLCLLHDKSINPRDGVLRHGIWLYLESNLCSSIPEK